MGQEADPNNLSGIPLTIGEEEDASDLIGDGEEDDDPGEPQALTQEDLDRALASVREQYDGQISNYQRTIDQLIQGKAPGTATEQAEAAGVDLEGLPDPVDKPKEYSAELQKRINAAITSATTNVRESVTSETDRATKANQLWTDFKTEYPDLAKKDALANTAAQLVLGEIGGVERAFADPAKFRTKVAERMRKELGIEEDKPAKGKQGANRTGGVKGGSKSAGGVTSKSDDSKGFVSQLKENQAAMGLI